MITQPTAEMNATGKPNAGQCPVQVMIVDDHPLMREGLRALLHAQGDLEVCAEAACPTSALSALEAASPAVMIVDLSLPGSGGLDLIREVKARWPGMPVLVLSMYDERIYAERVLRAGARGYVMKQEPPERVVEGVRAVLRGEMFVSSAMANTLLNTFVDGTKRHAERVGVERLSNREMQIFEAIGSGRTTRETAERLGLSVKTIETYRMHIKRKLGLENANSLIRAAIHWVEHRGEAAHPPVPPA
jgi:DNA-binding NarL/FixJ family response regulator